MVEHPALVVIDKNANFQVDRTPIVQMLNRMRPALPQMVRDPRCRVKLVVSYRPMAWCSPYRARWWSLDGRYEPGGSESVSRAYQQRLAGEGWDSRSRTPRSSCSATACIARSKAIANIPPIYGQFNDPWLKKDDPHISFLQISSNRHAQRSRPNDTVKCLSALDRGAENPASM